MFGLKHYIPVMKGKQGELGALGEIHLDDKSHFTPLWEIYLTDDAKHKKKKSPTLRLEKNVKDLAKAWGNTLPIFVDATLLDHNMNIEDGSLPLSMWFHFAKMNQIYFIPTTGLGRPLKEHQAIKQFVNDNGLCLRLQMSDLEHEDWEEDLEEILTYFEVSSKSVHLILDIDIVPALPLPAYTNGVTELIKLIPNLDEWITFSIVGGSFPASLAEFDRDDISKTPRREWSVWQSLQKKKLSRKPTFGDYLIADTSLPEGDPSQMRPSAAIRYTCDKEWLVVKGKGAAKHGYGQFHTLSQRLIRQPEYMGKDFCWGDRYIDRCARKLEGTGNLTTWRKVGSNHHIKFVIHQLANLADT